MRCTAALLALVLAACVSSAGLAEEPARGETVQANANEAIAVETARYEYQLAHGRLRQYVQAEYPLALSRLDGQIRLAEAELRGLDRQYRRLGPGSEFRYSSAFSLSLDHLRLAKLACELRLKDLQEQRFALVRARPDQQRLLEMDLHRATTRLAEINRRAMNLEQ